MFKKLLIASSLIMITLSTKAQSELPFYEIPDFPGDYSSGNVLARMIDGLGYRYHWASEGLTETDLNYKPSEEGRTTLQTLEHIHGLTLTIKNAAAGKPTVRNSNPQSYDYKELRELTLQNLMEARTSMINKTAEELESMLLSFQSGDQTSDFPLWILINGPIADAIYHTGQIVSFRRSSGNPVDSKMNVFTGKNRK